jgi:hypothetical protein
MRRSWLPAAVVVAALAGVALAWWLFGILTAAAG